MSSGTEARIPTARWLVFTVLLSASFAQPASAEDAARFVVKRDSKYGAIDASGKLVIEPQFDNELYFTDGLARVMVGSKVGYIDTSGKVVISPQAKMSKGTGEFAQEVGVADSIVGDFAGGLAPFRLDRKYGYLDKTGAVAIPATFEKAEPFLDGTALVMVGGRYGSIDGKGRFVIEPQFDRPYFFREGLAVVRLDAGFGYIDQRGKTVIAPQFNYAYNFAGNRARAQITSAGHAYGYIDKTGKVAVAPNERFKISVDYSDGLAQVRVDDKGWGFIDASGKIAIEPQFFSVHDFREGYAAVAVGSFSKHAWGYIDRTGKLVVPGQYEEADSFSEGLAAVYSRTDGYSYVDAKGKRVIGPLAGVSKAEPFRKGLARVWFTRRTDDAGQWGYVDRSGKLVWKGE